MNKKLAAAMVALLTLGMTASVAAQGSNLEDTNSPDADDTSTNQGSDITVGVSSATQIDVKPNSLDFTGLNIGEQVTEETTGTNIFGSLTLENIGSEYIDRVWAASPIPTTEDPFGTGDAGNHDAGNFLQIKPRNATPTAVRGDDSVYHYVNRYEFSSSWTNSTNQIPSYIRADPSQTLSSSTSADVYVGRLRAGDEWYFYAIPTGSSNDVCDGSGSATLRIGNAKHSSSNFGTVDFTNGNLNDGGSTGYSEYSIQETTGDYGVTGSTVDLTYQVDGSSVTRSYDLLTRCDTTGSNDPHVIRTRYNVQAGGIADLTVSNTEAGSDAAGSQAQFLLQTDTAGQMLLPGEQLVVDTAVEVPQGVAQGNVGTGSLTFYVTSDDDAQTS